MREQAWALWHGKILPLGSRNTFGKLSARI